ncbi:PP2C family serine/threonine-protein phosphatase [Fusibacter sp. JL216-2]|uniref:PP2C family serine/threonine-protein phosphatase n=1 Tax=Fusibacter sp. JL216-2 TaxID=3071453 RepID=UPI003D33B7DA
MAALELAYSSVRGNLHRIRELPNQDAIDIKELEGAYIISLADGHGSQTCFRSELGSRMAVEVAGEIIANKLVETDFDVKGIESDAKNICMEISKLWEKKVLDHLSANAFIDSEVASLNEVKQKQLGRNALLAYGTTLMSVLVSDYKIIVFNIGDAELLIKHKDSDEVHVLNPSKRIGNETESLSLLDAYNYFTTHVYDPAMIRAMLLATDGYPNSFKIEDGYLKVIDDLIDISKTHGMEAVQKNFESWLVDTSEKGSGDDITACFIKMNDPN